MAASNERLGKAARRDRILGELRLSPHLRTGDLAELYGVSLETIRRDVEALAAEGRLARAHGGVTALPGGRPDLAQRIGERLAERERIGRLAAAMIAPGESLMIDAGSTTLQFARHLAFRQTPVTVVTNGLAIALALGRGGAARVVLCPGDYLPGEEAVVGPQAAAFLGDFHADRCVLGASGLDREGASEAVPGFAGIKRAMLGHSAASLLLVDSSKFGLRHFEIVSGPAGLSDIVSEREAPPDLAASLRRDGARMHVAASS